MQPFASLSHGVSCIRILHHDILHRVPQSAHAPTFDLETSPTTRTTIGIFPTKHAPRALTPRRRSHRRLVTPTTPHTQTHESVQSAKNRWNNSWKWSLLSPIGKTGFVIHGVFLFFTILTNLYMMTTIQRHCSSRLLTHHVPYNASVQIVRSCHFRSFWFSVSSLFRIFILHSLRSFTNLHPWNNPTSWCRTTQTCFIAPSVHFRPPPWCFQLHCIFTPPPSTFSAVQTINTTSTTRPRWSTTVTKTL